ncbi:MAG: methyltransferase [Actinocatenispora sp.]
MAEAAAAPFAGWDFSWLHGRLVGEELAWDYLTRARRLVAHAAPVLDIDTGGGEVLASLRPAPGSVATEAFEPNVAVARQRLTPLGVQVLATSPSAALPVADDWCQLVLNRHAQLVASEMARVLAPGGRFLTQQVGSREALEINTALGADPAIDPDSWTLETAVEQLRAEGLTVLAAQEQMIPHHVHDIGALVYHLRAVSWQVPNFSVADFDDQLRAVDRVIRRDGRFTYHAHRFLIEAALSVPPSHC